ncbi:MAG TPA: FkbM family methyltransferase [Candidatus Binatia bacterium]|nr:FkbM family methyltransferase [Candidatus Binatia bacterium]
MSEPRPAAKHRDLIYDVGMHKGEDTDFYLKKGFQVVGFEADPDLAEQCRKRFEAEIRSSRLTLVQGAIVDARSAPTVRFYRNLDDSVWGTTSEEWKSRNERLGTRSVAIDVPAVDFAAALARYGVPYYLKIDIEGADRLCLQALDRFDQKPDYVSIESDKTDFPALLEELRLLETLGYTGFQAVQQSTVRRQKPPRPPREGRDVEHVFPYGASGLFGRELAGRWEAAPALQRRYRRVFAAYRWLGDDSWLNRNPLGRRALRALCRIAGRDVPGWYDTHARHRGADA